MTTLTSEFIGALDFSARKPRFTSAIDRLLYLRGLSDLGKVSGADLRIIAQHARERFFHAGSYLLHQGQLPGAMYFLVEGEVAQAPEPEKQVNHEQERDPPQTENRLAALVREAGPQASGQP